MFTTISKNMAQIPWFSLVFHHFLHGFDVRIFHVQADSPWLLGVVVGSEAMDATEMTSLLNAQVVTGDAQRIFSSVEETRRRRCGSRTGAH
jgi:hypothetical protein